MNTQNTVSPKNNLNEMFETEWEIETEPTVDRSNGYVPIGQPSISDVERQLVAKTLENEWLSGNSPIVQQFEEAFAASLAVPHAVSCNSGGMALVLMLRALGINPGDEIIVPSFTMIATSGAVSLLGAIPVFADCDPHTLNIDPASVARCISFKTKAVVCVHMYGHPCDMEVLRDVCDRIPLLEDAAEAHGAKWRNKSCGAISDAAAFGFYANKVMVCGEGGMVTTSDADVAERVRSLRHYCFQPGAHFWHADIGYSARLAALPAAVGLAQTQRLEELHQMRSHTAERYGNNFHNTDVQAASQTLRLDEDSIHGWWHFWVRVQNRVSVRAALAKEGIETRCGFVPLHVQPCYQSSRFDCRTDPAGCPSTKAAGREVLLLPTHCAVADADVDRICNIIESSQI